MEKGAEEIVKEKKEGLVLKQLPDHLRYAFLGGQSKFPVIISSALSQDEDDKLIEVLRRHKGALAWSILDIKGDQHHNLYVLDFHGRMLQANHRAPKKIKPDHERSGSS